jgi:hypothetical protein
VGSKKMMLARKMRMGANQPRLAQREALPLMFLPQPRLLKQA